MNKSNLHEWTATFCLLALPALTAPLHADTTDTASATVTTTTLADSDSDSDSDSDGAAGAGDDLSDGRRGDVTPEPLDSDPYANAANTEAVEDLMRRSDEQLRAGQDVQAMAMLREAISLEEKASGSDSILLVEPLRRLAALQMAHDDLGGAEISYGRIVQIIEQKDDVFSLEMVEPLTALGRIYNKTRRSEDAITVLRRARHITHRQLGILNTEQLGVAEDLAESYFKLGSISDANRENRFAYRVNERAYGADSVEMVPAINKLASWYERIGEFSIARRYYKSSAMLIENHYGPNDLRLVDPLQRMARTYRTQHKHLRDGERALERAYEIFEHHPEADIVDKSKSLIELGDWYMVTSRRGQAIEAYQKAWQLVTGNGATPQRGDALLGKPKRLSYTSPLPDPNLFVGAPEFYVDVHFSVNEQGNVHNIKISEATAHWRIQRDVRAALKHARFRPRFENGEPVLTTGLRYRWTYKVPEYDRTDVPASVSRTGDEEVP